MILKSISVILFGLVVGSFARDFARSGSCFHSDSNSYLKPGEFLNLAGRKCGRIMCQKDRTLSMEGCGILRSHDPDCLKFDFDYSQNYPACCQMICMEYKDPSVQRNERYSEPSRDLNEFGYQYSERDRYKRGGYSGGGYGSGGSSHGSGTQGIGSSRDHNSQGIGSSSWNQGSGSNQDRDVQGIGSSSWNQGSGSSRDRDIQGIGSNTWNQGSRPGSSSSGGHNHGLDSHSSNSPSGWGNQGSGSGGIHNQGSNFPVRPNQGSDRFPSNRPGSSTSHGIGGSSGGIHNQGIGGSSGSSGIHRPGSGGLDSGSHNHGIGSSSHSQHSGHGSQEHGNSFRPGAGGSGFNQGGFQNNNDRDHRGHGNQGNSGRDDKVHYSGDFGRTYGNQEHGQNSHGGSNSYGSGGHKKTGY